MRSLNPLASVVLALHVPNSNTKSHELFEVHQSYVLRNASAYLMSEAEVAIILDIVPIVFDNKAKCLLPTIVLICHQQHAQLIYNPITVLDEQHA